VTSKITDKPKPKRRPKKGVTPRKILAYVEHKSGKSQEKVAQELGVTQKSVSNWTQEVEEYLRQCPEYAEIGPRIAKMIPEALRVYDKTLKQNDLRAAQDVLQKYLGLAKEKKGDTTTNIAITVEMREAAKKQEQSNIDHYLEQRGVRIVTD